jgi:hypothetical protein
MYTATLKDKQPSGAAIRYTVEFSDGTNTVEESCIPQDLAGFKFWVKSRLAVFNAKDEIAYTLGQAIDVTEPEVIPPNPTQAEIDLAEWLDDYRKYVKVKTTLVDTGILTGNETQVVALKTKVQTNFKPAYLTSLL